MIIYGGLADERKLVKNNHSTRVETEIKEFPEGIVDWHKKWPQFFILPFIHTPCSMTLLLLS